MNNIKILYCTLCGKSGADVYFRLLGQTQEKLKENVKFLSYHRYWAFNPNLLLPLVKIDSTYDIIHSNAESSFVFQRKSKPLIVTVHCVITDPFKASYLSLAQKFYYQLQLGYIRHSLQKATIVVTVAKATERVVRDLFGVQNALTLYNGIDINLFKPIKIDEDPYPGKIKLLFVGNLTKRKGVDLLQPIMEKLDKRFLMFYTTGLRTSQKIFSDERMIPIGHLNQKELVYWYNLCHITFLPTRLEGLPYTIQEAMSCGRSVISTDCSGLPEIVTNYENGFLCKMDDISDFVDKINLLADNKQMRFEMGFRNRQKIIEHFNLDKMGKEYNEMYKRVLKEFR